MSSGKSRKWLLTVFIVLGILAAVFVGFVLYKVVSGMDLPTSGGSKRGSRVEQTEETPSLDDAPDPAAVALAIAEKEWEEVYAGIDEESLQMYTGVSEIISHCLTFREDAESDDPEIRLYEVSFRKNAAFSEAADCFTPLQLFNLSVQQTVNAYGSNIIAAVSVMRNLNADNSYPCAWDLSGSPLYAAEVTVDEKPMAVIGVFFNEYHAIETAAIPLPFALPDDAESYFDYAKSAGVRTDPVDTDALKTEGVLSELASAGGPSRNADEMASLLAQMVAEKAEEDILVALRTPEVVLPYCTRFQACSEEPDRVIRWDASGPSEELLKEVTGMQDPTDREREQLRRMLVTQQAMFLNGRVGTTAVAAGSQLATELAVSGLEEDAMFWLYYEDADEPCVLVVTMLENGNGCFDLTATPLYDDRTFSALLEHADGDELTLDDLVEALME